MIEPLAVSFAEEESAPVRLELLTVAMKLFFRRPAEMQPILGLLLKKAIQECNHPDVRDRALLYYRLLRASYADALDVVAGPQPCLEGLDDDDDAQRAGFHEFNTLALVFGQPPHKFLPDKARRGVKLVASDDADAGGYQDPTNYTPPGDDFEARGPPGYGAAPQADLLGGDAGSVDLLGGFSSPASASLQLVPKPSVDAGTFQNSWGSLAQVELATKQLQVEGVNPAVLEQLLGAEGIVTMASGTVGAETKMYLYAQQQGGDLFLVELIASRSVQVTVKSACPPALMRQFLDLVWAQLMPVTS